MVASCCRLLADYIPRIETLTKLEICAESRTSPLINNHKFILIVLSCFLGTVEGDKVNSIHFVCINFCCVVVLSFRILAAKVSKHFEHDLPEKIDFSMIFIF